MHTYIICAALTLPTVYHLWNDRNGERPEDKRKDIIIMILMAVSIALFSDRIVRSLLLAWTFHFLVFDYAIVYILKRRGVIETRESWFSYLGKNDTDDVLRQFRPLTRLLIKLVLFVSAAIAYFVL